LPELFLILIFKSFQLRLVIFTGFLVFGLSFSATGKFAVGKGHVFDASEYSIVIFKDIKGGTVGLFCLCMEIPHL
jgi:hypothetical protein